MYMTQKDKIKAWLDAECARLGLVYVSEQTENELKDEFIRVFSAYDKRMKRVNRDKISVSPIEDGKVHLSLVAWGKCYQGQYDVKI